MAVNTEFKPGWLHRLHTCTELAAQPVPLHVEGRLTRMVGLTLEAVGVQSPIGGVCLVEVSGHNFIEAEVVGFSGEKLFLMPTEEVRGLVPNARVIPTDKNYEVAVGNSLLGRVLDGTGEFLDDLAVPALEDKVSLTGKQINPMHRATITQPLDVGVRTINALLTVGRGQRLGLFAGSGVGKSVLLGMMTKFTSADVIVVGLIGERGREVKEFIDNILGNDGLKRAVVVAAPADNPPLMRIHGAMLATSIAEYYRDQGKNVLLLMDSLTRFAQAQREIALAIGEPPATKGYPPSVFAKLPQLVERAGNGKPGAGSITAFYTVLAEGDDQADPIVDAARAILDGHIVLSRELAESGHYPAIDIEASISRAMNEITTADHQESVRSFRNYYSTYQKSKDLISVGAYSPGHDAKLDAAVSINPELVHFLQQHSHDAVNFSQSLSDLQSCFGQSNTQANVVATSQLAQ